MVGVDLSGPFKAVAAGEFHSLGLKANGSIVTWGSNFNGQSIVPAPNSRFVAVAASRNHSLGLKANGSIVAWECGPTLDYGRCNVPEPNVDFIGIAAGERHNLGLKADGSIVAWGDNSAFQIAVPEPNSNFVAVSAGWYQSLGLKADGSIVAWGCGNQLNYDQCNIPAPNSEFLAIAAGEYHSLAIRRETPLGDFNGDYAVDLTDYAFLVDALLGPFANPQLPNWFLFNFDGDFDLADLAEFQNSFGL